RRFAPAVGSSSRDSGRTARRLANRSGPPFGGFGRSRSGNPPRSGTGSRVVALRAGAQRSSPNRGLDGAQQHSGRGQPRCQTTYSGQPDAARPPVGRQTQKVVAATGTDLCRLGTTGRG